MFYKICYACIVLTDKIINCSEKRFEVIDWKYVNYSEFHVNNLFPSFQNRTVTQLKHYLTPRELYTIEY